jgi:hypothetical protein
LLRICSRIFLYCWWLIIKPRDYAAWGKEKASCSCAAAVCTYLREMVEEFVLLL